MLTELQKKALTPYSEKLPKSVTIVDVKRVHATTRAPDPVHCDFCERKLTDLIGPYGNSYNLTHRELTLSDGRKLRICYQSSHCVKD